MLRTKKRTSKYPYKYYNKDFIRYFYISKYMVCELASEPISQHCKSQSITSKH